MQRFSHSNLLLGDERQGATYHFLVHLMVPTNTKNKYPFNGCIEFLCIENSTIPETMLSLFLVKKLNFHFGQTEKILGGTSVPFSTEVQIANKHGSEDSMGTREAREYKWHMRSYCS